MLGTLYVVDSMCLFSFPSTVFSVRGSQDSLSQKSIFKNNHPMFSFIIR